MSKFFHLNSLLSEIIDEVIVILNNITDYELINSKCFFCFHTMSRKYSRTILRINIANVPAKRVSLNTEAFFSLNAMISILARKNLEPLNNFL